MNSPPRLFIAQWVRVWEAQWLPRHLSHFAQWSSTGDLMPKPIRSQFRYSIAMLIIPAKDEEAAYEQAICAAANDIDVNLEGPGHRNFFYALGLHELEEYPCPENATADLQSRRSGITSIQPIDLDKSGIPRVREKEELQVFRDKLF